MSRKDKFKIVFYHIRQRVAATYEYQSQRLFSYPLFT